MNQFLSRRSFILIPMMSILKFILKPKQVLASSVALNEDWNFGSSVKIDSKNWRKALQPLRLPLRSLQQQLPVSLTISRYRLLAYHSCQAVSQSSVWNSPCSVQSHMLATAIAIATRQSPLLANMPNLVLLTLSSLLCVKKWMIILIYLREMNTGRGSMYTRV